MGIAASAKAPEWSFEALRARSLAIDELLRQGHSLASLQVKTDAELQALLVKTKGGKGGESPSP